MLWFQSEQKLLLREKKQVSNFYGATDHIAKNKSKQNKQEKTGNKIRNYQQNIC